MNKVALYNNLGSSWNSSNNVWVKGSFFDHTEKFYSGADTLKYFDGIQSFDEFLIKLEQCNGLFSVVIIHNDEIWAAVDRNTSFPLFYFRSSLGWHITDKVDLQVVKGNNFEVDAFQVQCYKAFSHTMGDETLFKGLKQMQCGQALLLRRASEKPEIKNYHQFSTGTFLELSESDLYKQANNIFNNTLKRLIESLEGKTAVVPLSGGFDSRWIAAGLKRQGYEKVICFTFGKKTQNKEYELSKKVAERLQYPWIFVEYTAELLNKRYLQAQTFQDYVQFMGHGTSMFFLQEYFAVSYLKEHKLVPDDAVFIPGHSGDLIGGSQIIKTFNPDISREEVLDRFFKVKNIYQTVSKEMKKKLEEQFKPWFWQRENHHPASVFEALDIQEKIAKVIFNSSLVFDFFGYEKRFPFWDLALLQFFLKLPFEHRVMKKLYDSVLINEFFKPYDLLFDKELNPRKEELLRQKVKNRIKTYFPVFIKECLLQKNDWKNYRQAVKPLQDEMKSKGYNFQFKGKSYNEILIQYYLYLIETNM
ncbi:MAG: asparagine synthase-related protein [Salinivirgaceae bacterium]